MTAKKKAKRKIRIETEVDDWANWVATDGDGDMLEWENRPTINIYGIWRSRQGRRKLVAFVNPDPPDPSKTLRRIRRRA